MQIKCDILAKTKNMNQDELRSLMIENKNFLKFLFESNSNQSKKEALTKCESTQLDLIINILFYIVQGEIPVKRTHYESLKRNKKLGLLHRNLNSQQKLKQVLNFTVKAKLSFLLKLVNCYNNLFYRIFFQS